MQEIADQELTSRGRVGDREAINELFRRHHKSSLKVARRIVPCEAEAEDAVQAAYCAAFEHFQSFRGDSSFSTWVTRIVVNQCLMARRDPFCRRRVHPAITEARGDVLEHFVSPTPSPEKSAWRLESARMMDRAVRRLPKSLHAVFMLYAVSEMSSSEVAQTLGLSVAAVKCRVFRARHALKASLASRGWSHQL